MAVAASTSPRADTGRRLSGWLRILLSGSAGRTGIFLVAVTAVIALVGPIVAPYSPLALGPPIEPPSTAHWLGTDQLGRDVLSRVLFGGRHLIFLPMLTVLLAFSLGATVGLLAGYKGGAVDQVIVRAADIVMSVPPLLLVLIFVISLGASDPVLVTVVALFFAPRIVRVIRGSTHWVCSQDYVTAARARGESTIAILSREILPNITGPLLAELALRLNYAIIFIATINFLGLGVQPPSSDWGLMVSDGRALLGTAPLVALAPTVAIGALTIGVNLISDQISAHLARNIRRDARL